MNDMVLLCNLLTYPTRKYKNHKPKLAAPNQGDTVGIKEDPAKNLQENANWSVNINEYIPFCQTSFPGCKVWDCEQTDQRVIDENINNRAVIQEIMIEDFLHSFILGLIHVFTCFLEKWKLIICRNKAKSMFITLHKFITFQNTVSWSKFLHMINLKTVPVSCDTAILSFSWQGDGEPSPTPSQLPSCYHSKPETLISFINHNLFLWRKIWICDIKIYLFLIVRYNSIQ